MDTGSDISACAGCLCLASRQAARAVTQAYDRTLRPHGIRATQFTILVMLTLRGPTPLGVLAKALVVERTTLTRNLALLGQKGWVATEPGPADARVRVVSITQAGQELVRRAFPAWRKAQEEISATFGEAGAEALRKLAATVVR
jgi:DNA-binding MarR family transcriptional regulator